MISRATVLRVLCSLSLLFGACAEGGTGQPNSDNNGDDGGGLFGDTGGLNSNNGGPDSGRSDTANNGNPCGVCCPGDRRCIDMTTSGVCSSDGSRFDEQPCGAMQVCLSGTCMAEPVCTPGSTRCLDASTVLECRATGEGFTSVPCPAGESCVAGQCTSGGPNGIECNADADCASNNCHCGNTTTEMCPVFAQPGYCATMCDSCGEEEVCLNAMSLPLGDASADYDHCVPKCTAGSCTQPNLKCIDLPVKVGMATAFDKGCYFQGVAGIGEECASDAECSGGACLRGFFNTSYCSRRCDADGVCPTGSACVNLQGNEFWCSLLCGDGSIAGREVCSLDLPTDRFDVTCKVMTTQDGSAVRACSSP